MPVECARLPALFEFLALPLPDIKPGFDRAGAIWKGSGREMNGLLS
jgi:hypothetical protein